MFHIYTSSEQKSLKYDWNKGKFFKFCDVSITWSDMHWLTSVSNIFDIIFLQTAKFDINVTLLRPWRSFDAKSQDTIDWYHWGKYPTWSTNLGKYLTLSTHSTVHH